MLISVNDEYKVPKGSTATVKPIGIFGDVAVALTPPMPAPAQDYAPGDTVPTGPPPADIDEIMTHVDSIGLTTAVLLKALKAEIVDAGTLQDAHRAIASAATLSAQLQSVIAEQNRNVTATMRSFSDAARHLSSAVGLGAARGDDGERSPDVARTRRGSSRTSIRRTRRCRDC